MREPTTKPLLDHAHKIGVMDLSTKQRPAAFALAGQTLARLLLVLVFAAGVGRPAIALSQEAARAPGANEASQEASQTFRPVVAEVQDSRNWTKAPESVAELLDLESRIRAVVEKVLPATVGLVIGQGQGSGVIVSPDGYVLTAAHVAGRPGSRVFVIMPDGTRYNGVSLGVNRSLDDGLVKIIDRKAGNDLPWAPLGSADALALGSWTVALGHPGGYQQDRPPVVRVGRILAKGQEFVLTDNTLVGGDSGGPLFDLDGRVIGIHSRIEGNILRNVHVPSDRFIDDWDQLAGSKDVGGMMPAWMREGPAADVGLRFDAGDTSGEGARVARVIPQSPADKAGFQIHDRVIGLDDKPVTNGQDAVLRSMGLRAGKPVTYTVRRGAQTLELRVTPIDPSELGQVPNRRRDPTRAVMGVVQNLEFSGPGVHIESVPPGGPAAVAGIQGGDILLSYNGQFLRNAAELGEVMSQAKAGEVVSVEVLRGTQRLTVEVTLRSYAEVYPEEAQPN